MLFIKNSISSLKIPISHAVKEIGIVKVLFSLLDYGSMEVLGAKFISKNECFVKVVSSVND